MTTDNIIPIARPLNVLLGMDSYQDMTDEEIDMIIEYRVESAISERDTSEMVKTVQETSNALVEISRASHEIGIKKFKEIISQRATYEEVSNE